MAGGLQPGVASRCILGGADWLLIVINCIDLTVDSACNFEGPKSITPFAFRTHAHTHG